ncbi:MAG: hypothetical protein M5U33_00655 [Pseudorhodoplanes sp.]|nr:hypothetical protein [Pseudorhodoplanes sp.]
MPYRYFDYAGRPARIMMDDHDIPESCEVYDTRLRKLVRDDTLTLDVMDAYDSRMISAEEFAALLSEVQQST